MKRRLKSAGSGGGGADDAATKRPRTFIVVLNWNGLGDTVECLESLERLDPPGCGLIVVDNGSTDGSVQELRKRFPDLELIETGRNLGFAGGNNVGMERALELGAEYVILLNNDTVVDPAFAVELERAAAVIADAGILCSKVYFFERPDEIWYAGASFSTTLGWGRMRGFGEKDRGQYDRTEETPRPCGCAMMVTRRLCEQTGLFDADYFCYAEDTDWGMRAAREGFKVLYVPTSKVWHKGSSSTGGTTTALSLYYNVRNILLCLQRNSPAALPVRAVRVVLVAATSLMSLFTMQVPKGLGTRRIYQGLRDYLRGRYGKFAG